MEQYLPMKESGERREVMGKGGKRVNRVQKMCTHI
jgi:hypothetical protein